MTWPAILLMSGALVAVTVLAGWCYYRVLTTPERDAGQESAPQKPNGPVSGRK